jgi:hypothetical protein
MEMIFNELSTTPISANRELANQKVAQLVRCYKEALELGFDKIRFDKQFYEIELSEDYSLANWLDDSDQHNLKDLLLSAKIYPFIRTGDIPVENQYLQHDFNCFYGEVQMECSGLAVAHIYDTLSVSFSGTPYWEANVITVTKTNRENNTSETVNVNNVFSTHCFQKNVIQNFIANIRVLVLVPSPLLPAQKEIHFRPDHGTDVLDAFARRIRNNVYIHEIMNSLPFNNRAVRFIRRVYPNGIIEIVLHWTDEGFGMVVQTSGRNQRETEEIARLLTEEYDQ